MKKIYIVLIIIYLILLILFPAVVAPLTALIIFLKLGLYLTEKFSDALFRSSRENKKRLDKKYQRRLEKQRQRDEHLQILKKAKKQEEDFNRRFNPQKH